MSSRASGDRVEARTYAPPPGLADVIASLWVGAWDLRGQAPHVTELLGDPCVHVVFEGGDAPGSRLVGVWTRLWTRTLAGRGRVRAAKLHAGAARAFLDPPASAWTDRVVPLADVLPDVAARAPEVLDADETPGLVALAEALAAHRRDDPGVADAVAAMAHVAASEVTRVDALARACGCSVRALQRLFRDHVGLPPKAAIRRARLQEAARRVEAGEAPDLAGLAYALGYADQAHLARDFRAATGRTLRGFEAGLDVPADRPR